MLVAIFVYSFIEKTSMPLEKNKLYKNRVVC